MLCLCSIMQSQALSAQALHLLGVPALLICSPHATQRSLSTLFLMVVLCCWFFATIGSARLISCSLSQSSTSSTVFRFLPANILYLFISQQLPRVAAKTQIYHTLQTLPPSLFHQGCWLRPARAYVSANCDTSGFHGTSVNDDLNSIHAIASQTVFPPPVGICASGFASAQDNTLLFRSD